MLKVSRPHFEKYGLTQPSSLTTEETETAEVIALGPQVV